MDTIGKEMERMEYLIHDLRAENEMLRSIIHRAKGQVPATVWTWHEGANEALK